MLGGKQAPAANGSMLQPATGGRTAVFVAHGLSSRFAALPLRTVPDLPLLATGGAGEVQRAAASLFAARAAGDLARNKSAFVLCAGGVCRRSSSMGW